MKIALLGYGKMGKVIEGIAIQRGHSIVLKITSQDKNYNLADVDLCYEKNGAFIYASNFSLGVNIFFELNKTLSKLMKGLPQYSTSIEEIHHTQKLDAPSGTAISLANDIITNSEYKNWTLEPPKNNELGITAKRIENVPGTHEITYESSVDTIQIKHTAHNRDGFALGAVIAAEWIVGKHGIFTMKDVLNIG